MPRGFIIPFKAIGSKTTAPVDWDHRGRSCHPNEPTLTGPCEELTKHPLSAISDRRYWLT
jgi:hypothetical protein